MNEEIMNEIQPVRPKDQFTFSCRQCGACCRNIEGCVMVESLDAYRLARYLRTKGEPIWNCSVKAARHLMNTAPLLQSWLSPS